MSSDKAFLIALGFSAVVHGIILFQNQDLNLNIFPKDKKENLVEVSYLKKIQENKEFPKPAPPKKEDLLLKFPHKITAAKTPPPFIDRESIFTKNKEIMSRKSTFIRPSIIRPDIIAVKKKISMPQIDLDKIDNPSYISYYQIVREKIKRMAYQNYTRAEVGEVYLSFLIFSDGSLKSVRLIEEKSSPNPFLREIALRSIDNAAPFPSFPKELDYPQLSFNVVISFEIE